MSLDLDFERLNVVDTKTKMIVNGYIRRQQRILPVNNAYYTISDLIICLIVLFFDYGERFEINDRKEFIYNRDEYGYAFHIYGRKRIERGIINQYTWVIVTNKQFGGVVGIIDEDTICQVNDGKNIYFKNRSNTAAVGTKHGNWSSWIFGQGLGVGYSKEKPNGDIIAITLDFDANMIKFKSYRTKKILTGNLPDTLNCARLIIEFGNQGTSKIVIADRSSVSASNTCHIL